MKWVLPVRGGKVAGRRVSQVWVTARAEEQRDGALNYSGESGQLGCAQSTDLGL